MTFSSNLQIKTDNLRGRRTPLYWMYCWKLDPQDAYVELDETGCVTADYNGEIGNAVTDDVWNNRTLRWPVSPMARGDALAELLESPKCVALLERIYSGHDTEWNGSNWVGVLDDDAEAASEALERLLKRVDIAEIWGVNDWLRESRLLDCWSGCSLNGAAAKLEHEADSNDIVLEGDLRNWLLDHAMDYWRDDRKGLDAYHLNALIAEGYIDENDAADYISQFEVTT